jgi:hypothetical protein
MNSAGQAANDHRRDGLWNWSFWVSILAFETLGVFLAHHS